MTLADKLDAEAAATDFETPQDAATEATATEKTQDPNTDLTTNVKALPKRLESDERGVLIGSSLEEEYRLAKAYSASGLMPKALNTTEKVLVALQICRELNLPPMQSVGKIMVIGGAPALFGDLPLALVKRSGLLRTMKEEFVDDGKGGVLAAICCVVRRGEDVPVSRTFSVSDARTAGLWNKPGPWTQYPKRMLQMRARSWALKDVFPDVLGGVGIVEWDETNAPDPEKNLATTLNETFLDAEVQS